MVVVAQATGLLELFESAWVVVANFSFSLVQLAMISSSVAM